jgi:GAF domain-containing protein
MTSTEAGTVRMLYAGETPSAPLTEALGARGWQMTVCSDLPEALRVASVEHPALAVVTGRVGGGDGLDLVRRLRASVWTALMPVIAVVDSEEEAARFRAAGAQGCVLAGEDPRAIADTVQAGLETPVAPPARAPERVIAARERIEALQRSGFAVLDAEHGDPLLRRLTGIAAALLPAPVSFVSLVGDQRQLFAGRTAQPTSKLAEATGTALTHSFCQWAVAAKEPLVVADSRTHPVLRHNPAVTELDVIAYAGVPLLVWGQPIGTVCAIDAQPREWTAEDLAILGGLARVAVAEVRLRLAEPQRPGAAAGRALMVADALAGLRDALSATAVSPRPGDLALVAEVLAGLIARNRAIGGDLSKAAHPAAPHLAPPGG